MAAAAAEMRQLGSVESLRCNIRREEDVRSLHEFTLDKFGRLDFLVNNGGGQFPCGAADMTLKGWNAVVETNLTGTYLMCREAHRQFMGEHGGAIVNIIADMFRGFPMMSHTGKEGRGRGGSRDSRVTAGACRSCSGRSGEPHPLSGRGVGWPGGPAERRGPGQQHLLQHCRAELRPGPRALRARQTWHPG